MSACPAGANLRILAARRLYLEVAVAKHDPVMVEEVLTALRLKPGSVAVDGTLGLGGHTLRFIDAVSPGGTVVGLDWDESMLALARERVGTRVGVTVHLRHDD